MTTNFTSSRSRDRRAAFTLIEIVLVLAIIALLVGAGIFKLRGVVESGQKRRVDADLSSFQISLNLYRTDAGTFPTTEQGLKALVSKPTTGPVPKSYTPYMKGAQLDPWGLPYGYRFPPTKNKGEPDIWSFGPDMTDGTDDDMGNWEADQ
jgi:general secretion pathway protein G